MSGQARRLKEYSKSFAVRSEPSLHFRPSFMVKVQVRPSSETSGRSAWPGTTSLFSSMSSSGSKVVMMVLAPSIALFSAGSRVSGLEPSWTVKPLAEVPVASVASLVAASVDAALLASVAAELAEPPHAAREAAMQPAIATAAMFFIFMNIPSKYNVLYTQSPRETSPQRNEYLYFTTLNPQFQVVCKFCNCFDRKSFCVSTAYSSMSCGWMFAPRAHFGVKHKAAAVSRPV